MQLCVDGWAAEVAKRYGAETMAEIEWAAWNDQVVPELERMQDEFLPAGTAYADPNQQVARSGPRRRRASSTRDCSRRAADIGELSKEQLVTWLLGSHEYLLQCIEAWAAQIVVRYGLDEMFDIQCDALGRRRAAGREEAQGRVPRHHRQHGRRLDEGPPDGRDRRCRARRSTSRSRCPSPTSAS